MNPKNIGAVVCFVLLTSCASIPGPPTPLGLGPELDQMFPLLIVLFVVGLLIWKYSPALFRSVRKPSAAPDSIDPAKSMARERYARGEITRDEFLRIAEDLEPRV